MDELFISNALIFTTDSCLALDTRTPIREEQDYINDELSKAISVVKKLIRKHEISRKYETRKICKRNYPTTPEKSPRKSPCKRRKNNEECYTCEKSFTNK